MNFDSFYEDFVDSAELSWSSTSSASSGSFDSSSDTKCIMLPEIKLENETRDCEKGKALHMTSEKAPNDRSVDQNKHSEKLRCFHCRKKLGIIMIMKCHCNQYFCSAHRYMESHNCTYNFKVEGKKKLERENPLCVTQKLPKI
jgi:AN1-like Zinc finger